METRAASADGNVSYVDHFRFPDSIPEDRFQFESEHEEVKE